MMQLVISALGPDRPGIVGELTGHIHAAGGNILESRMVNLRGEFAAVILLECPPEAAEKLQHELPEIGEAMGLRLSVTPQSAAPRQVAGLPFRLKTYSMDQPGIVARLTNLLRQHGVNIEELTAGQQSAAFAGSPLFLTEMRLTIPPSVGVRRLREELEALCNELNCDVDLEPAEG